MTYQQFTDTLLVDAYRMEHQMIASLKRQAKLVRMHYPTLSRRLFRHAEESAMHAKKIAGVLRTRGVRPLPTNAPQAIQPPAIKLDAHAARKSAGVWYLAIGPALENFEIAQYKTIQVVSRTIHNYDLVRLCDRIIRDDMRMMDWVNTNAEKMAKIYVSIPEG